MRCDETSVREIPDVDRRQVVRRDVDDLGIAFERQVPDLGRGDPRVAGDDVLPVGRERRVQTRLGLLRGKEVRLAGLDLDGPPGRVHLELPHPGRAVAPAGDDAPRVGRPVHGRHDAGVSEQPLLERAGRRVPDAHRRVARPGGDPSPVGAPRDGVHGVRVSRELEDEIPGAHVEHRHDVHVRARDGQTAAVRAQGRVERKRVQAVERVHDRAGRGLGHSGRAVLRPDGGDEPALRVEGLPHGARLPLHARDLVSRFGIPHDQEAVVAGRSEHRAVGREPDVVHVAVHVADPRPDGLAGRRVAQIDRPGILRALGHEDALGTPVDGPAELGLGQHDPRGDHGAVQSLLRLGQDRAVGGTSGRRPPRARAGCCARDRRRGSRPRPPRAREPGRSAPPPQLAVADRSRTP